MMTLTKKVEFALIILKYIEEKKDVNQKNIGHSLAIKAQEIAKKHSISENFIAKVMQKLCQKQILLSKQGAQGGYYLNIDLAEVSLLQLLEALDGHFTIVNCINDNKTCIYDQGCSIIDPMRHLNDKFRKIYQDISLSEILVPYNNRDKGNSDGGVILMPKKKSKELVSATPSVLKVGDSSSRPSLSVVTGVFAGLSSFLSKFSIGSSIRRWSRVGLVFVLLVLMLSWGMAAEVNVYSYRQQFLIEGILDKFRETTGIKVNVIFIDKGLAERIKLEGKRSPADVILTTDIGQLSELEEKKIVQSVNSRVVNAAIPSHLRHSRGLWFALTTRARILYASKERVKEGEIKDYFDLAQPRWKGRICIRSGYHPYNLALFSSFIAHEGVPATEKFLKGLRANLARKPQGNDRAQIKAIKEGLCDVSIGNSYYYALMLFNHSSPQEIEWAKQVNLIFPNQGNRGTHYNVSGMALARYSPNRESAIKLMEFLVSDLAQYIYASENYEFPVKEGTPLPSFLKTYMSGVKWDTLNLEKIAAERRRVTLLLDKIQFDR